MRLATYEHEGAIRVGVVVEEAIHQLPPGQDVIQILMAGAAERARVTAAAQLMGERLPLSDVALRVPLTPRSIRDFVCFEQHVEGIVKTGDPNARVMPEWYEAPHFYFTNHAALFGPDDAIAVPPGCELLDFELEIAAVVGRAGRDLTVDEARDHIAGYVIYNDWSARDLAGREVRLGRASPRPRTSRMSSARGW